MSECTCGDRLGWGRFGAKHLAPHRPGCPLGPPYQPKILTRVTPGALVVTIDGKCHRKPMTADRLVDLAEDCLRAAIDMRRGE